MQRPRCLLLLSALSACAEPAKPATTDSAAPADPADPGAADPGVADPGGEGLDSAAPDDTGPAPCPLLDGALPDGPEGDFLAQGGEVSGARGRCEAALHATAGAAGATLALTLPSWEGGGAATLRVTDLLGRLIAGPLLLEEGEEARFSLLDTGEVMLSLAPVDPDAPANAYRLSARCVEGCDAAYTRYPLVLMHGMGGTDAYVDVYDYYFGVVAGLEAAGYRVEAPAVDAFATIEDRAAQWQDALDGLEAAGVGRRFNLIAHSQGGLDARYLAGGLKDPRIASLITVGSPHHGSAAADAAAGLLALGPTDGALLDLAVAALAGLIGLEGDDLSAQTAELSTAAMADFNAAVPDADGVYYASWAGHSCPATDLWCQWDWSGEVVELALLPTWILVNLVEGDNDGLVSIESAQWGDFQGEIPADHLDEVGQIADVWNPAFDHLQFYADEAARLAARGL